MSTKRSRHDKPEKSKKSSRFKSATHGPFISENTKYKLSILYKKQIISGRTMGLSNFEHLNFVQVLKANYL